MQAVNIIAKKRDGLELTSDNLQFFVNGYTSGSIPNYWAGAWCMAVLLNGKTEEEATTVAWSEPPVNLPPHILKIIE